MFGNYAVVEAEKPILDTSNFKSFFHSENQNGCNDFVIELETRLSASILQHDWECEDFRCSVLICARGKKE